MTILLKSFVEDGLIVMNESKIECSQMGSFPMRNIVMAFDAYMHNDSANKKIFSKWCNYE
ncbi:MAG: hypothetical protein DSZ04_01110 [Sulfurimonas sp.]|nr:MAG: hypothetical protein DSZ04_01110 [Sulfurimonas sp.]